VADITITHGIDAEGLAEGLAAAGGNDSRFFARDLVESLWEIDPDHAEAFVGWVCEKLQALKQPEAE
jgi:hypothetical protein